MKKISKSTIGIRVQDFHEGLKDVTAFGPKEAHMQNTLLLGKAATLASHLKGLNYVDDIQALTYLGAELGISGIELKVVLRELEELDFASVVGSSTTMKRVELRIPELRDSYEHIGERWEQMKPGEIEKAALYVLEDVVTFPHKEGEVQKQFGIDDKSFRTILEIGSAGALIEKYAAKDEAPILYSPLTIEEKPDALLQLANKFPEHRVVKALQEVQAQQGIPLDVLKITDKEVVTEAILLGVFCPVRISAVGGEKTFLFTPRGAIKKEERVILEKARAILACVRCGEHYSKIRKIKYPRRILETLRDNKRFAYPRPDFPEQYGLLVTKQIGFIEEEKTRPGFYNFTLHDTPENLHALNIAIDLLEIGQSSTSRLEVDAKEILSVRGSFSGTLPTRSKYARGVNRSRETDLTIINELSKLARGIIK